MSKETNKMIQQWYQLSFYNALELSKYFFKILNLFNF